MLFQHIDFIHLEKSASLASLITGNASICACGNSTIRLNDACFEVHSGVQDKQQAQLQEYPGLLRK